MPPHDESTARDPDSIKAESRALYLLAIDWTASPENAYGVPRLISGVPRKIGNPGLCAVARCLSSDKGSLGLLAEGTTTGWDGNFSPLCFDVFKRSDYPSAMYAGGNWGKAGDGRASVNVETPSSGWNDFSVDAYLAVFLLYSLVERVRTPNIGVLCSAFAFECFCKMSIDSGN